MVLLFLTFMTIIKETKTKTIFIYEEKEINELLELKQTFINNLKLAKEKYKQDKEDLNLLVDISFYRLMVNKINRKLSKIVETKKEVKNHTNKKIRKGVKIEWKEL